MHLGVLRNEQDVVEGERFGTDLGSGERGLGGRRRAFDLLFPQGSSAHGFSI
jgi:hypothetical protein